MLLWHSENLLPRTVAFPFKLKVLPLSHENMAQVLHKNGIRKSFHIGFLLFLHVVKPRRKWHCGRRKLLRATDDFDAKLPRFNISGPNKDSFLDTKLFSKEGAGGDWD